jgi:hypothetical protein
VTGPATEDPVGQPVADNDWPNCDKAYLVMLTALLPEWLDDADCHAFDGLDDAEG